MSKPDLKVLSFPEFQKKAARKARWKSVVDFVKNLFHSKSGFEKYKIIVWGNYSDTKRAWVDVQNLKTGKVVHKTIGAYDADFETVEYFVSKLK